MPDVTFRWDPHALDTIKTLGEGAIDKAVLKAVAWGGRDALRKMRVQASKSVRDRKALTVKRVNDALGTHNPRKGAALRDLVWTLTASGAPIAMRDYPHRDTHKTGVWVTVNKGARQKLRHAFEVRLKNGHVGIFNRVGGVARLPIKELFTTRLSEPVGDVVPELLIGAQVVFSATFDRVVRNTLAGKFK
jgi:hypothetical protein